MATLDQAGHQSESHTGGSGIEPDKQETGKRQAAFGRPHDGGSGQAGGAVENHRFQGAGRQSAGESGDARTDPRTGTEAWLQVQYQRTQPATSAQPYGGGDRRD